MGTPNNQEQNYSKPSTINVDGESNRLNWLAGYFDIKGSCTTTLASPMIQILNTNPKIAATAYSIFKTKGIESTISERSHPSKSSKKKRWDVFAEKNEAIKIAKLLLPYSKGKQEQLSLLQQEHYDPIYLKYLNWTNHTLIGDNLTFYTKFESNKYNEHNLATDENARITTDDFNNKDWLAGVIDATADIKLSQMDKKGKLAAQFNPIIEIEHQNKKIITAICSTLKNNSVGFHVSFSISKTRNMGKWRVTVSGFKRVRMLLRFIMTHLLVKKEISELLNIYIHRRLKEDRKSIDDLGYSTREAIITMEKAL